MKKTIKDLQVEIETIKKMQNERKLDTKIQELKGTQSKLHQQNIGDERKDFRH